MTLTSAGTLEAACRFVTTSPLHTTLFDMDRRLIASSAEALSMLPENLRGPERWPALVEAWPEARTKLDNIYERLAAGQMLVYADDDLILPDGSRRLLRSHGSYWLGPDGEPVAILCLHQDTTAEVQAEEERRRYEMQLRAVVDNLPAQISLIDLETRRVLLLNDKVSGGAASYSGALTGGSNLNEALSPASQARLEKIISDTERAGVPTESELVFSDGTLAGKALRTRHVIFRDERGRRQLLWIGEDVTELRESREALKRAAAEAEAANRAKSEFLANMSHEIRTPLNGVMGVAGALARTALTDEQQEMVSLIGMSAKTLETLLSDILDLARIEAGKMEIHAEPFDLAASVNACANLFAAAAEAKGLDLSVRLAHEALGVYVGDAPRLRQILCNLLGNAVKFTGNGQVTLTVDADRHAACSTLRFQVHDTGPGFDADIKARLFSRFEQADGSVTRRFGGSGLGLAICQSLAEAMGGHLEADAAPGSGAVFSLTLELPRHGLEVEVARRPDEPEPTGGALEGMRVLLAEDHPTNRRVVQLILGAVGVDLTLVENGVDAVEACRAASFDLVLMDMQMPLMDGLTATRAIRELETAAGTDPTPILVLSANAMPEHVRDSVAAGADGHIAKPIDAEELLREVMKRATVSTSFGGPRLKTA
jgi:signal transduction histidine kinase/CheY-like chemotaxis protein